ncbi:hypothetical protein GLX27_003152 [Malassezia furfur]|uniref:Uncharacterized protein n=1 Tax=Malassezia furfur TaxID=55194 RepID=A0ABY8EUH7_MALFU|nr:hypothetical protein CBS14141_002795 [Malassezia furfur]WFD48482.1 hypothetical protein GLX27_003152 [Malassezia furfur]
MPRSASAGRPHDYKAHFTRTRLAYDKVTARQTEMEAAATKAMQMQQALQEEVDFLLDAIAEIHARAASEIHTERAAAAPAEVRTPKGRAPRRAVAYSDDEDDEPPAASAPLAAQTDASDEAAGHAKRVRSTPGTSEVDDDVLASLGDDDASSPKRARLA